MMSGHGLDGEQPRWPEIIERFPGMRQLFNALCALGEDEDASGLLEFVAGQDWMADLARCAASVARLDGTMPVEPETDELLSTLWQLYAASRVRDALLLAHQPAPADDSVRELDKALHREQPRCRPVPVAQTTEFFAAIGCEPVTEAGFDPILHEIIACEPAADPNAPIEVTGQAWPALMIGELVFGRAGVRVRAGAAHAVPGIADRSTLHWAYWRRHRQTSDGSHRWGHNSQWRTEIRRDYLTSGGRVYDYDAFSTYNRSRRLFRADDGVVRPLTQEQASFIKNRCLLRGTDEPDCRFHDCGIAER